MASRIATNYGLADYDLVIVGATPEGFAAAERATRLRSRVALVRQGGDPGRRSAALLALLQQSIHEQQVASQGVGLSLAGASPVSAAALWRSLRGGDDNLSPSPLSLMLEREGAGPGNLADRPTELSQETWGAGLQLLGGDWLDDGGCFVLEPSLHLQVGGRSLRARRYLLAPAAQPEIPSLAGLTPALLRAGLASGAIATLQSWPDWPQLPQRLAILGTAPQGLGLAQALAQLGCAVTLVSPTPRLLPEEDGGEALITALLQTAGVRLYLGVTGLGVTGLGNRGLGMTGPASPAGAARELTLSFDQGSVRADALLLAQGWRPAWQGLNLELLGLPETRPLSTNAQLRTAHRQVYACGAALGGPGRDSLAQQEALVALRNCLWWAWWKPQYSRLVRSLPTVPRWAQIGLSPAQAERQYPGRVTLVVQEAKNDGRSQLQGQSIGLVQLVVHRNGKLLGAQALGNEASAALAPVALALSRGLGVRQLARLLPTPLGAEAMVLQAAAQWRWDRLAETPRREDLIERFFNWRRTGSV